ncbi:MAG TPA: fumarylacetoacetate hydrolase family protein [Symbiobacteriaceae bacterium]|nr:fumarylacetoacetate hydrolase family protein [Symbiobacteriaceae bacterium]
MRLVTVSLDKVLRPGRLVDDGVVLYGAPTLRDVLPTFNARDVGWVPAAEVKLRPPIPHPQTIRDFYAFEAHVKNARARRGLGMIPEWYNAPVFYFSNTTNVFGPNEEIRRPSYTKMLDFELEVAAVIGTIGYNIHSDDAEKHIAGFMIMNDWSARDVQREEMKVGLGPAKGKDFATSFGPWLVTPDELADRRVGPGLRYNLEMVARINGKEVSRGNLADMHFHWGELLARASQDCTLWSGEIIGSGTVGTGCLLETGAAPWLEPGDVVELEVERLGVLRNQVR